MLKTSKTGNFSNAHEDHHGRDQTVTKPANGLSIATTRLNLALEGATNSTSSQYLPVIQYKVELPLPHQQEHNMGRRPTAAAIMAIEHNNLGMAERTRTISLIKHLITWQPKHNNTGGAHDAHRTAVPMFCRSPSNTASTYCQYGQQQTRLAMTRGLGAWHSGGIGATTREIEKHVPAGDLKSFTDTLGFPYSKNRT